jgi:hypothetical protein
MKSLKHTQEVVATLKTRESLVDAFIDMNNALESGS